MAQLEKMTLEEIEAQIKDMDVFKLKTRLAYFGLSKEKTTEMENQAQKTASRPHGRPDYNLCQNHFK